MLREIIEIDEDLCIGCSNCVPNCRQGALQIIDGKCRLISDLFCEGLGACVGHCPTGAMTIEEREAEEYNEHEVMERISAGGANVIRAHLEHLEQHKQDVYLAQAHRYLEEHGIPLPQKVACGSSHSGACPGSSARRVAQPTVTPVTETNAPSELRQWPIQLHLVPPHAEYFQGADVLLAADCTAFAVGAFHREFMRGKALAIACPKLDQGQEIYVEKLTRMIDEAKINTLSVVIMGVPCCGGLIRIAQQACAAAMRKIPVKQVVLSLQGQILHEEWVVV